MPTNDFLPFGSAAGANVMTQADYAALAARLSGFASGTANSAQLNKAWRQSSLISAVIGQLIANRSGQNALDDGTTATLLVNLELAINGVSQIGSGIYAAGSGTANAHTAAFTPPVIALTDGMVLKYKSSVANTGACTFNPNGLGAKPIVGSAHSALQGGEIVATGDVWLQYNTSIGGGSWLLIDSTGGALQVAPASQSQHALPLGQANSLFGGNTTIVSATGVTSLTSSNAGLVIVDATAGNIAIGLPVASTTGATFQFVRVDATANTVTIARSSTDLIGGTASLTLTGQYSTAALRSNGTNAWHFLTGAQRGIIRFTASGTWVCPAGITTVYVSGVAAGGGGGGGGAGVPGAGGGARQSDVRRAVAVVPGTSYTVTIGTPGGGGALNTGGGNGGITSLGALVSLNGGNGGSSNGPGGNSGGGIFSQSGQTCSSTIATVGGQGGSSAFGGGGMGGLGGNTGVAGATNSGSGGGGGGGGGSGNIGAAGGSGLLVLEW